MPLTLYQLKPAFQSLLRPLVARLARRGVTANVVTTVALLGSATLGTLLALYPGRTALFLLLPVWMLVRMGLNAIDGMLAREFGQQSALGAYLNELADVVSDAALMLPFVFVPPLGWASVGAVIFLATVSEMAGALGPMVGAPRRYDGPMGKSDRAFAFGALALAVGLLDGLPGWAFWLMPAIGFAIFINTINRVRNGVRAARRVTPCTDAIHSAPTHSDAAQS
ncbi:CDP-alcohol phosphatidyltransferase family protein [Thauera sp.]|jgi:CDP-diacylglycerol--glycerol-3-phosphate 3-phosphatidyltransferase|uniref:CDP-alcohol phosphatidyltransferase family protein n=1 Tax=Thauera sp. TaxID=1905334 RepID=UPI002A35AEA8|nr:CDP-alcohol phosphatidyltransferase family protein [Thauera sp.]MDX9887078.1 CDP-alcohol phosphatidyltransferase family protein [Thauera sp.]